LASSLKSAVLGFEGLTLYDLLELYGIGIAEGALSNRAGAIAFSFLWLCFLSHFYLKFNSYIPRFSSRFLKFVEEGVPPNTFYAIENIINDILHTSNSGLSTGFVLSIFLMLMV
jgi:membrane protein